MKEVNEKARVFGSKMEAGQLRGYRGGNTVMTQLGFQ